MQKVIVNKEKDDKAYLDDLPEVTPIFAKNKSGQLAGMLVKAQYGHPNSNMWILKLGGSAGATGYHITRQQCIDSCIPYGYEFYVDL